MLKAVTRFGSKVTIMVSPAEEKLRLASLRDGGCCALCGRVVGPKDLLVRLFVMSGYYYPDYWSHRSGNVCSACLTPEQRDVRYSWCPTCLRPFSNQLERARRTAYCSERCVVVAGDALARAKRQAALLDRTCPVCFGVFKPSRADMLTCSNACRQRAYRERYGRVSRVKLGV